MKKEFVKIGIAFAVLLLMAVGISLYRERKAGTEQQEEEKKKLVTIDFSTIDQIVVKTEPGKVVFKRRSKDGKGNFQDEFAPISAERDKVSEWLIIAPFRYLPDPFRVDNLFEHLEGLKETKLISEKGKNPADYNLEKPPVAVELYEKGESAARLVVRIGDKNSADTGLYVQTSESPRIVLAGTVFEPLKTQAIKDWRMAEIVGIRDVSNLKEIKRTGIFVANQDKGGWQITKGQTFPGDKKKIDSWAKEIAGLKSEEIVSQEGEKEARKFGLHRPLAEFSWIHGEGDQSTTRTVLLGEAKGPGGKELYLRRLDFPFVHKVDASKKESLLKPYQDLVSKKPFPFSEYELANIQTFKGKEQLELQKGETRWSLTKPISDRADQARVKALVSNLIGLEAGKFLGKGVKKRNPELAVQIVVGTQDRKLEFFPTGEDKPVKARLIDPSMQFEFAWTDYSDLKQATLDLREKGLMPVKKDELAAVEVEKGILKFKLEKDPKDNWKISQLVGAQPIEKEKLGETAKLPSLINQLDTLTLESFENELEKDIGPPFLKVAFFDKEGTKESWVVGQQEEKKRWIRSDERNVMGKISEENLEGFLELFTQKAEESNSGESK